MNYQRIYNQLIKNRQNNPFNGYTEKHHIIPKSHGGSNDKKNIVVLSAREHFVAHWLLWRIHRDKSMAHAFITMIPDRYGKRYCNSRGFAEARKAMSEKWDHSKMSEKLKGNQHMKGKRHSESTKQKIGASSRDKTISEETRLKMSKANAGRNNRIGFIHSEETKLKMSNSAKKRWQNGKQ